MSIQLTPAVIISERLEKLVRDKAIEYLNERV